MFGYVLSKKRGISLFKIQISRVFIAHPTLSMRIKLKVFYSISKHKIHTCKHIRTYTIVSKKTHSRLLLNKVG